MIDYNIHGSLTATAIIAFNTGAVLHSVFLHGSQSYLPNYLMIVK